MSSFDKNQPIMKTTVFTTITLFLCTLLYAQNGHNLDFETLENDTAKDWSVFGNGDYKVTYDTSIVKSGNVSGAIESTGDNIEFNALAYKIPANFGGQKIKLTGYLKTENVEGFAGLWLRIDPQIGFDNMRSRKIEGTNDWKKYEIELKLDNRSQQIVFGGLLSGSGKIWVDDLEITIDGKPLDQAPAKELDKAQKDKEFDKGSTITFANLDAQHLENLDLLGRVWGFLKYYHPQIAKGNFNWDYELFRILPIYQNAKTNAERDAILIAWIDKLGNVEICKSCKEVSEDAFLKPDLNWMTSNTISKSLSEKLKYIQKNRNQGDHYYIGMMPGVGNPEFKNENPYSDMTYPDAGFRLLSVYRYWNMINYFFPNKHLTDKDWDSCLAEYIPKFINAKDELEYEIAALQMIADIKDTHANLWGGNDKIQEQRGDYFAPVHVRFIENQLVVDAFFDEEKRKATKLEIGDVITHINGKRVYTLIEDMNPFYPASNQPTRLRDISFDILRSTNNLIALTIKRQETTMDISLDLFNKSDLNGYYRWYPVRTERSFKKISDDIGYVTLQNINDKDIDDLKEEFKGTKGIIVDIRNYPSTFVPFKLGNYLNSNRTEFVKFTQGSIDQPGEFTHREGHKVGLQRGWTYKGQNVIVLVNEISQSQAEYTAMAFRAGDKTTIIGSTTAGADGNVSSISLPGGLRTMISGIGIQYPDGGETQRVGIIPDIEIKPTITGIREGRDELMEKALDLIRQSIKTQETIKN
jgi:C-terminal processing protease CtpA/Prc